MNMPYNNLPKSMWSKMDDCKKQVMKKGQDEKSAIAICYSSMMKGKELAETMKSFELKAAPNYRVTQKSIMDAPNLRGDDVQRCLNCKYAQAIVTDDMAMPMDVGEIGMGVSLICTQYDFLTDPSFVCDGYEAIPQDLTVMKESNGHYRWFGISSSSYQDNDGEIVSQKALEQDTERMNQTGEFGTVDWWHTPIILGDCDVSIMHDHVSIESGKIADDFVGEQLAKMKGLGMSRTFYNPINEPDAEGVYHNIRTFSRAILPAERASNRLTVFGVSAKENKMTLTDKAKDLANRFIKVGVADDVANAKAKELLDAGTTLDTAAADAKLQQKETAPVAPEATQITEEKKPVFIGDMTTEEFDAKLTGMVEKFLTPAVKEIGAQVAKMNEAQAVTAKETSDKLATSMKESNDKFAATIKSQQDIITDVSARLAALEGLRPRAYRSTEDPNTKVDPVTVKEKAPKGDDKVEESLSKWLGS